MLARRDVLLHHPYDSFTPVIGLIPAGGDHTQYAPSNADLYRAGPEEFPDCGALIEARDADTQVATLVELKARFDEGK